MSMGGHMMAARVIWNSQPDDHWQQIVNEQSQLDQALCSVPDVNVVLSCVTTVFTRNRNPPQVFPSVAYWVLLKNMGAMDNVLAVLQKGSGQVKTIHGHCASDPTDEAYKCLGVVLKDHNSPWVTGKLTKSGVEVGVRPLAYMYAVNPQYLPILCRAQQALLEAKIFIGMNDPPGSSDVTSVGVHVAKANSNTGQSYSASLQTLSSSSMSNTNTSASNSGSRSQYGQEAAQRIKSEVIDLDLSDGSSCWFSCLKNWW